MTLQSVVFHKDKWTKEKAIEWLKSHNKKYPKVDETEDSYRFRQISPKGFTKFRSLPNKKIGITFVFGY